MQVETPKTPVLSVRNLAIGYKKKVICANLTFDLFGHEMVALIGRNGCGKSTFLKTLANIIPPLRGEITYPMCLVLSKSVSVVFTSLFAFPNTTIHDIIAMGRIPYISLFGHLTAEDEKIITQSFEKVHLRGLTPNHFFGDLSDGQKQKVLIAKAIAQQTPIILLDEPTSYLDIVARAEIMLLLRELVNDGRTVLISTHEIELVKKNADRFITFTPSNAAIDGIERLFEQDRLQQIFGKAARDL